MSPKRRARQRRACAGKIRHATAVAAGRHAEQLYQAKGDWVRPYQCRFCGGGWHVGH